MRVLWRAAGSDVSGAHVCVCFCEAAIFHAAAQTRAEEFKHAWMSRKKETSGAWSLCSPTSASSSSFHALHVSFRSFYLVRTTARGCCITVTRLRAYTNIEEEQICALSSTNMLYLCVPQRMICSQFSFYICFKGLMQLLNVLTLTNKLVWRPLMIKFMSLRPTPA